MGSMPVHRAALDRVAAANAAGLASGRGNASGAASLPKTFLGDYAQDDMLHTLLQWLYHRMDATR